MTNKEKFIKMMSNVKREGTDEFMKWLEKTDFYSAPASTKYHGAYEGGLLEHSLNVYECFREEVMAYFKKYSGVDSLDAEKEESITIMALLHDLCKVNFYAKGFKNQKNQQTGEWEKVPYYTVDNQFNYGHGEKSVWLIQRFIRLNTEESIAIRWHMGGFDEAVKGGSYDLSGAWTAFPLAMLLHVADLKATYLMDK